MASNALSQYRRVLIDWFVPAELARHPGSRLKATRTVLFGWAMLFWAPVFAPLYYFLGSTRGAMVIALAAAAVMLSMVVLRLTQSVTLSGNLIAGTVYSCLLFLASFCGGIESASLWWLAAVPIIGLLLCGVASGIGWSILSCAACITYFLIAWNGITVHHDIRIQDRALLDCVALCGIVLCATTLTLTFKLGEAAARTEMEAARNAAEEANRAKSAFLANMSHELRTPMNGILGLTELVLTSPLQGEQREYLRAVYQSADNLCAVLNEILDFARIDAGKLTLDLQPFDLYENLRDTLQPLGVQARTVGLVLVSRIDPEVPRFVVGDGSRLRQIVTNLVGNALKFTEHGEIVVAVQRQSVDQHRVVLDLTVTDTGIGIPTDKQPAIFRAFEQLDGSTTRKYGGTGLGLAICTQLAALMEGQLTVESQLGRGSTFHLTIPFCAADAPYPSEPAPFAEPTDDLPADVPAGAACTDHQLLRADEQWKGHQPLRVLVAEDSLVNQKLIVGLLQRRGNDVTVASNGNEVLRILQTQEFDLILMDVQMPDMDGLEATAEIRRREQGTGRHLPIIAVTAHAMKGDCERCLAAGMDGYVAKPIRSERLFETIENILQKDGSC